MKKVMILILFVISFSAAATEYKVVFLPGTVSGAEVKKEASGAYFDPVKTEILNKLAKEGWRIVAVTGQSGADHAIYLERD